MKNFIVTLFSILFVCLSFTAISAEQNTTYTTDTGKKVFEQLANSIRSDEERKRDINRKPVETLEFFGLRDDMTVVELLAGGGWYTKILGSVLQDNGKLYLAMGTSRLKDDVRELGTKGFFEATGKVEGFEKTDQPGFIFDIGSIDLGVSGVDMVLTFRNVHNLSATARKKTNDAVFKALKPGGIYGVVDHTKRHMEAFSEQTWRRIDPVIIIKEALDSGFEFAGFSNVHSRPEDSLEFDSRHESLINESDRFTLKFRKPK